MIDKKTGDFVGWSGLKYEKEVRQEFNYYDLGYRLRRKYWGQGIATETSQEALKYGFEKLGVKEIGAAANVEHVVSNHILQKVGLQWKETFDFEGIAHNWYILTQQEWKAKP